MKLPRRQFLHLAVGAAALPAISRISWAQTYPTRPVRIVVPFAPGGLNDIATRLVGQWLSERLGQQFLTENRPGAGSNIGTETVVRSSPDGYTLLAVGSSAAINATLYDKLNYNFIHDVAPVAGVVRVPQVMQVHPSIPVKTVAEFVVYVRANPGKIAVGSGGNGSPAHVALELFKMMAGIHLVHVPYRGSGPAITDLLGGQIQATLTDMPASIEYIRAGRLRALAVGTATRSAALPDVPTIGESVPGFEASQWTGIFAPVNTSSAIIGKLNAEINAGLADAKLSRRFADLGGVVLPGSPADFAKLVADETEKWGKVVKFSGAKPE
jgi:tripartite-type tricarboxylate transporter receptor subunit TctC